MSELIKIEESFENMVKIGKVDISIISLLKKLKENLTDFKKIELEKKKSALDYFHIFHAVETQIRIINYMMQRIEKASGIHDNPKVADDALVILPQFKELYFSLNTDMKKDTYYILGLSSGLQVLAMKNNMYPSPKQIIKSVDTKALKVNFNRFVDAVGEEVGRI